MNVFSYLSHGSKIHINIIQTFKTICLIETFCLSLYTRVKTISLGCTCCAQTIFSIWSFLCVGMYKKYMRKTSNILYACKILNVLNDQLEINLLFEKNILFLSCLTNICNIDLYAYKISEKYILIFVFVQ